MNLDGSVAFVTGGARGGGRGIALAFARRGASVVVTDLLQLVGDEAKETVRAINELGARALLVDCDVRSEEALSTAVGAAVQEFGRIDHVVANAGVIKEGAIDEMAVPAWREVIDVNLTGSWLTCRAVAPVLMAQRQGSITVISSVAAARGGAGFSAYCASKAGILGMVRALSHELAPANVRVNAILPGYVATEMWFQSILGGSGAEDPAARQAFDEVIRTSVPLGRPQTVEDLGEAALYLAGADNVTGAELVVDGGRLAGP